MKVMENQKNNVIINVGISGSGKSTWTINYLKENPNYLRINRDQIRLTLVGSLDGYYNKTGGISKIERIVNNIEEIIFKQLSYRQYNIIVDNTNLNTDYIHKWTRLSKECNYEVKFKLFDCPLKVAQHRVYRREYCPNLIWSETDEDFSDKDDVKYIEKQFEQYKNIKEYIIKNYAEQII